MQRFPHCPPLRLAFCDSLPPCSAKAAAAAAAQPSGYVWATRDAVGDAESITDELRAAGLMLNHVHRWVVLQAGSWASCGHLEQYKVVLCSPHICLGVVWCKWLVWC
jgi:hypothetical protein